ncbi:MAG: 2-isopropylmalate synthase [Thermoguttaceae bacterium]
MRHIKIFDTTLRDGEQSPGASMNLAEKLEVAHALADLGVDVIEAGFPIASPGDFESVREVAKVVRGSSVCGLARCTEKDIDAAHDALRHAERPRIHVFLATSPIHRKHKLRMSEDEVVARAVAGVQRARNLCDDVEFSAEDASRTEPEFLARVTEAVIAAGASTVNIPDTVGYSTPPEMFAHIDYLMRNVPNIDRAILSVHCHNDLGMAVANSLAAVTAGAGQIECTINGLGERAGNGALEEIVMAIKTRSDVLCSETRIVTTKLVQTSRLVSAVTGLKIPRNKAIVGRNAFAHESGIHQDGMLKERSTYEIMRPEDVGLTGSDLVLGKHSGRAAIADRVKTLGFEVTSEELDTLFAEFKKLADRKKEVFDGDITALIAQLRHTQRGDAHEAAKDWTLSAYEVRLRTGKPPQVSVTLRRGDSEMTASSDSGDGPVDALVHAIRQAVGAPISLMNYTLQSVTAGEDAQGEASVLIRCDNDDFRGQGVSTDTLEATAMAIVNAVNRIS